MLAPFYPPSISTTTKAYSTVRSPQIHRLTAEMGSGVADNELVGESVGSKSLDLMAKRV